MCGIAGIIDLKGEGGVDPQVLDAMVDVMVSRGPDDRGVSLRPPVAMGMRRLSIIDVEGGHQPITNEDGTVTVVMNGELYSFPELRDELVGCGHTFSSRSDTEVLVHGFEEWGIDGLLARLNGMFAFALRDDANDVSYIVRDRIGIKPLLYAVSDHFVVFGSTTRAVLSSGLVDVEPDPTGVRLYLHNQFVPGARTLLRGVSKLPAAHYLRIANGRVEAPQRYWQLPGSIDNGRDLREWSHDLAELFRDAVRIHMISDVEVGVFLSGGLDSSTVLGVMSQFSERPIKAFSIAVDGEGFDETPHARAAAERFGAEFHSARFTAADVPRVAEALVGTIEEPIGDPACLPTYFLSQLAARDVKVVLTGEGADELFAGYGYYERVQARLYRLRAMLTPTARRVSELMPGGGTRRRGRSLLSGYPYVMSARDIERLIIDMPAGSVTDEIANLERASASGLRHGTPLDVALRVDTGVWLPDDLLMKVDRTTMAHSLEARVPFLDYRLVEMAMRIPSRYKVQGTEKKVVMRRAFAELLGDDLVKRGKHGFGLPMGAWIKNELRELLAAAFDPTAMQVVPWLDAARVHALFDRHVRGSENYERELWSLFMLVSWFERAGRADYVRSPA